MKQTVTWLARTWTIVWKSGLFFVLWGILLAPFIVPFAAKFDQLQQSNSLQLRLFIEITGTGTILAVAWFMVHYIDHRSFLLDLRILWLTIVSVVQRRGISQPGSATAERFGGTPR